MLEMSMLKRIKYRGFTDRLYFYNLLFAWIYTMLCLILTIIAPQIGIEDYSYVSIVCPLIWAELGLHTGLVVWKAKVENLNKWAGDNVRDNASMNINVDI